MLKAIGIGVVLLFVILIIIGALTKPASPPRENYWPKHDAEPAVAAKPAASKPAFNPDAGVRAAGHLYAKKLLPKLMNNPRSAELPWDTVGYRVLQPGRNYLVFGKLRGTNAFNAVVTHDWSVAIEADEKQFWPMQLFLDGESVWKSERMMKHAAASTQPAP